MSVKGQRRKSEGELVNNHTFGIGVHVNPTAIYLQEKGIQCLPADQHYATGFNKAKKTTIWFRSPERVEKWRQNTSMLELKEWTIKIENHGRSANLSNTQAEAIF
jgi:hypothetical protein